MFYFVYILQSGKDSGLYMGMTGDLKKRLIQHQSGESQSTKARLPWALIYYEAYLEKKDAEGRERYLKSGSGRRFLDKQIKHHFLKHPRILND